MAGLAYVLMSHPFEIPSILMQTDVPIVASTYVRETVNVMKPSISQDVKRSAISAIEVCRKGLQGMGLAGEWLGVPRVLTYRYNSMYACMSDVVAREGWGGLYRGSVPSVLRYLDTHMYVFTFLFICKIENIYINIY